MCNAIEDTGNLPFLTAIFQAHDLAHFSLKFKSIRCLYLYLFIYLFTHYRIKEQLGCGQFATVHHGVWRNQDEHDSFKDVAVKCLKGEANEEERIKFLQEAAIMGQFDHPNILQMLALSYDEDTKVFP